jgi:hypothetical protein
MAKTQAKAKSWGPFPDDELLRSFGFRVTERAAGKEPRWVDLTGADYSQREALDAARRMLERLGTDK